VYRVNPSDDQILLEKPRLNLSVFAVWAIALCAVLTALGSYGVLDNNEGLYAEIPREMLASHDWHQWVIPSLNGLPYMEKPPLLYWLTAISFSLFGVSEWSARLVPALSSLSCVALLIRFGTIVDRPQAGRLAALMFVSGMGVTIMSRTLMFDMLLTAFLTAALIHAFRFIVGGRVVMLRLAYAALALAVMAKGIVAAMLFGAVLVPVLIARSATLPGLLRICRTLCDPIALLIFVAIAAPWHIVASLVQPIFPWFYFINEHVLRFLGKREPHDYYSGAWWYYLPRMALYLFPWSFLLPSLMLQKTNTSATEVGRILKIFLCAVWLMPLLFFSLSSAKANYYLIVVMPFAAFQLALALQERDFLGSVGRAMPGLLIALFCALLAAAMARRELPTEAGLTIIGLTTDQFLLSGLIGASLLAILSALLAWRRPGSGVLSYLMLSVWCIAGLLVAAFAIEPQISTRQLVTYLQSEPPGRDIYLFRNFEELSSLPFYLQHPVGVIDSRSNDLFWGNQLKINTLLINGEQFRKISATRPIAVVVLASQMQEFNAGRFVAEPKRLRQFGKAIVVTN